MNDMMKLRERKAKPKLLHEISRFVFQIKVEIKSETYDLLLGCPTLIGKSIEFDLK